MLWVAYQNQKLEQNSGVLLPCNSKEPGKTDGYSIFVRYEGKQNPS